MAQQESRSSYLALKKELAEQNSSRVNAIVTEAQETEDAVPMKSL